MQLPAPKGNSSSSADSISENVVWMASRALDAFEHNSPGIILELDFTEDVVEAIPRDPFSRALQHRKLILRDVVDNLRHAATDQRVRAVIAKIGRTRTGLGRIQELRDAIADFRQSGKPTVAWAETFGELAPGTTSYYLASAFEQIWLQPSGDIGFVGLAGQVPFFRDALDRIGVQVEVGKRDEYKNFPDIFTEHDFTAAHREAAERTVASAFDKVINDIAHARNRSIAEMDAIIQRGLFSAGNALTAGLIDRIGYRDEVYAALRKQIGHPVEQRLFSRYTKSYSVRLGERIRQGANPPSIALIRVHGAIAHGRSGHRPFGRAIAGSDTITAALRTARRDEHIRAIVLRVDSPGGSYSASDAIWREVMLTRKKGIPVIASMGDVAGSGGYYVSMAANSIVAQPATLTGSIGVFAGKQVFDGLLHRLGINHGSVTAGSHALMFSPVHSYSDAEWEQINSWLDRVYQDFVAKVGQFRGMTTDEVHQIARGRVWTGSDAYDRGLVDELGGLSTAIKTAIRLADLPADCTPEIKVLPRTSFFDQVRQAQSTEDPAAAVSIPPLAWSMSAAMSPSGPAATLAACLGLSSGALQMPQFAL